LEFSVSGLFNLAIFFFASWIIIKHFFFSDKMNTPPSFEGLIYEKKKALDTTKDDLNQFQKLFQWGDSKLYFGLNELVFNHFNVQLDSRKLVLAIKDLEAYEEDSFSRKILLIAIEQAFANKLIIDSFEDYILEIFVKEKLNVDFFDTFTGHFESLSALKQSLSKITDLRFEGKYDHRHYLVRSKDFYIKEHARAEEKFKEVYRFFLNYHHPDKIDFSIIPEKFHGKFHQIYHEHFCLIQEVFKS
jgi:hypothetical protein